MGKPRRRYAWRDWLDADKIRALAQLVTALAKAIHGPWGGGPA